MRLLSFSTKQTLKALPGTLPLLFAFKSREVWPLIVNRHTRLCVSGFPRSANSFAFHCLHTSLAVEPSRIAHHTHSHADVLRAVRRRIPVFVLIREPLECCLSLTVMRKDVAGLEDALRAYAHFHTGILPVLPQVNVFPTEQLVANPAVFLTAAAGALELAPPQWDAAQAARVEQLMAGFNQGRDPRCMTIPNPERERAKQELWSRSESPRTLKALERCQQLRRQILVSARLPSLPACESRAAKAAHGGTPAAREA